MFKSKSSLLTVLFALVVLCLAFAEAVPQRNNNNNGNNNGGNNNNGNKNGNGKGKNGGKQTAQQKAAQKPGGITQAEDGSTILDMTMDIK